jgi:hypothetical protein
VSYLVAAITRLIPECHTRSLSSFWLYSLFCISISTSIMQVCHLDHKHERETTPLASTGAIAARKPLGLMCTHAGPHNALKLQARMDACIL